MVYGRAMKLATAVAAVVVSSVAAAGAPKPMVSRPAALFAVVTRDAPRAFDGPRAFATAALPAGALPDDLNGTLLHAVEGIVGAPERAVDPTGPIYVLMVDDGNASGLVLVGRSGEPAIAPGGVSIKRKNGWSAIGVKPALDAVADYALTTLIAKAPPTGLTATIYAPGLLARFKDDIAEARTGMLGTLGSNAGVGMSDMFASYVDGLLSVAADLDEVQITLDGDAANLIVDAKLAARPGSRLAKFISAQRPSDFSLLSKLPDLGAFEVAGTATLGPYHDGWLALTSQMFGVAANGPLVSAFDAALKASNGDFAIATTVGTGVASTFVFGAADAKALDGALGRAITLFGSGLDLHLAGFPISYKPAPAVTVDGVALHGLDGKIDTSKTTPQMKAALALTMPDGAQDVEVAQVGSLAIVASGPPSIVDAAKRFIAIAHGTASGPLLPPTLVQLVTMAREHRDSLLVLVDLGGMLAAQLHRQPSPAPFAISIGFDRDAHVHIAVPTATVHSVVRP